MKFIVEYMVEYNQFDQKYRWTCFNSKTTLQLNSSKQFLKAGTVYRRLESQYLRVVEFIILNPCICHQSLTIADKLHTVSIIKYD